MVQPEVISGAAGILGALVGGLVTGIVTYKIEGQKIETDFRKNRQQLFSQLKGQKSLMLGLYGSLFAFNMRSGFLDCRCELLEKSTDADSKKKYTQSLEKYWDSIKKSDEYELELAKANRDLWVIIGSISLAFPYSDDLKTKTDDISKQQKEADKFQMEIEATTKKIKNNIKNCDEHRLEQRWYDEQTKLYNFLAYNEETKKGGELAKSFDNLLDYLNNHIT